MNKGFWTGMYFGAVWLGLCIAASSCGQDPASINVSPTPVDVTVVASPQPCTPCKCEGRHR